MRLRVFSRVLLTCSALLLTGVSSCSQVKLVYRFADTWAVMQLDKLFDLNGEQKKLASKLIQQELRNTLLHDLPKLKLLSEEQIRLVERSATAATPPGDYLKLMKKYEDFFLGIVPRLERPVSEFAATLSPKQIDHFSEQLSRRLDRFSKRLRTDENRQAEKRKRFGYWQRWNTGEVDSAALAAILTDLDRLEYPWDLEIRSRREFIPRIREKDLIQKFAKNPLVFRTPEFARAFEQWSLKFRPLQWRAIQAMTPQARADWVKTRREQMKDLEELRAEVLTAK